jgi:hypothetical protein
VDSLSVDGAWPKYSSSEEVNVRLDTALLTNSFLVVVDGHELLSESYVTAVLFMIQCDNKLWRQPTNG